VGNKLSETDREGHESTFDYDNLYRLESETNPNYETTSYTYDLVGNLTSLTDPVSNTTTWTYDELNRKTAETNDLNETCSYVQDAHGRLTEKTDRLGRVTQYDYDALDRLTEERWLSGITIVNTIHYVYDDAGQVIEAGDGNATYSYVYDDRGRITEITQDLVALGKTVVMRQELDAEGRRTQLSVSVDGTPDLTNTYDYDSFDRLASLTQSDSLGGATVADKRVDFTYLKDGRFKSITRYADLSGTDLVATTDYGYDANGRLMSLVHRDGSTILAGYEYEFDAAGRMTAWTNLLYSDESATFDYDDAGQLTSADRDGTTADESYDYDDNGNREAANGSIYSTGGNNQLESDGTYTYEYDAAGNRVRRTKISDGTITEYGWDHRNRLISLTDKSSLGGTVTMVVTYAYDLYGRRLAKTLDADGAGPGIAESEYFVYDGDQIALTYNDTGDVGNRYLYGVMVDQVLANEQTSGVVWALADHLGTLRDLATHSSTTSVDNHRVFDTFGNLTSETGAIEERFAFTGRELDTEVGLYYYRARYYDATVGRFLSEDPIGFTGGDPSLTRYVLNSPTDSTDPAGLRVYLIAGAPSPHVWLGGLKLYLDARTIDLGYPNTIMQWGYGPVSFVDKWAILAAQVSIAERIKQDLRANPLQECEPVIIVGHSLGGYIGGNVSRSVGEYMLDELHFTTGVDYLFLLGSRDDYQARGRQATAEQIAKVLIAIAMNDRLSGLPIWSAGMTEIFDEIREHMPDPEDTGFRATLKRKAAPGVIARNPKLKELVDRYAPYTIAGLPAVSWPSAPTLMNLVNITAKADNYHYELPNDLGFGQNIVRRPEDFYFDFVRQDPHIFWPWMPWVGETIATRAREQVVRATD